MFFSSHHRSVSSVSASPYGEHLLFICSRLRVSLTPEAPSTPSCPPRLHDSTYSRRTTAPRNRSIRQAHVPLQNDVAFSGTSALWQKHAEFHCNVLTPALQCPAVKGSCLDALTPWQSKFSFCFEGLLWRAMQQHRIQVAGKHWVSLFGLIISQALRVNSTKISVDFEGSKILFARRCRGFSDPSSWFQQCYRRWYLQFFVGSLLHVFVLGV